MFFLGKKDQNSHTKQTTNTNTTHLSSVDAERKQLASSSFAARVLLFHFLVLLSFENCFYCFCRRRSRTSENGRHTFFAHDASAYVFEEQQQQQQIFPGFRSVLSVALSENEKNNTSESYERRVVFRVASSRWSSVGVVFGGGVIVFVCVLINNNKHGVRGVDSRRGFDC